jgi:thiol-disulfide isomerase/thioredoxin
MKQKYFISFLVVLALAGVAYGSIKLRESDNAALESHAAEIESYKQYSADTERAELAAGKRVVIFFYADWCPDCRKADVAFKTQPQAIPENVTVLKIDYNSDKQLERKLGVLSRHTFVEVDKDGNAINKWVSGDIDMLRKYVH